MKKQFVSESIVTVRIPFQCPADHNVGKGTYVSMLSVIRVCKLLPVELSLTEVSGKKESADVKSQPKNWKQTQAHSEGNACVSSGTTISIGSPNYFKCIENCE